MQASATTCHAAGACRSWHWNRPSLLPSTHIISSCAERVFHDAVRVHSNGQRPGFFVLRVEGVAQPPDDSNTRRHTHMPWRTKTWWMGLACVSRHA